MKDVSTYWNEKCQEAQSILWSPDEINLCNSEHLIARLPNNTNPLQMCPLELSSRFLKKTIDVEVKIKQVTRKIRIYPLNESVWIRCLQATRRAYNLCIAEMNGYDEAEDKKLWKETSPCRDKTAFRRAIRKQVCLEFPEVPSVLIDEAVNWAYVSERNVISLRSAIKKGKVRGDIKTCKLNFLRRHDQKQSFFVQKLAVVGPFPTLLKCHITESIPSESYGKMANVVFERGRWFLCVKVNVQIEQAESQSQSIVACDPGVRTFLTTFAFDSCAKIGSGFSAKIRPMLLRLDKLISERDKHKNTVDFSRQIHRDRHRYFEKRIWSIKNKVNDLICDLHKRAANWLTKNYDIILLPPFRVSEMVGRLSRKISSQTVRAMIGLSHYKFKIYLYWIANKRGKTVVECSEAYTSCTDSRTGEVIDIGSSSLINGMDRDVNGARGILLRALAT